MTSRSTAFINAIANSKERVASFIYPSFCLHCDLKIESQKKLCSVCMDLMEFSSTASSYESATFQAVGPALCLVKAAKGPFAEETAKSLAAFMALQQQKLGWPFPDYVCPSPTDPFHKLLAFHLSSFLSVPYLRVLRPSKIFCEYRLRKTPCLSDKILLIVSLYKEDPEEFFVLHEADPGQIFFLSVIDGERS